MHILALSGGGANGAFGAGVLNGLYESGELPHYSVITGISAGALIAPFAFVGGEELLRMKRVMLGINDKMVLGKRNLLNTLIKDAFTNGESLYAFIERSYPDEMIEAMAQQHRQGRRLFIGTTHFDSAELVIWNLGQIAASDLPNKAQVIHQVLAASASIPGVFPPQFIEVDIDGETYEELHVDGGLASQVFYGPASIDYHQINQALGLELSPKVHVIRNGTLDIGYQAVPDKGINLLSRSLKSLTIRQTRGDLYRMLYYSNLEQVELTFTYINADDVPEKHTQKMFDIDYMQALYDYGYSKALSDGLWTTQLP
ncbi:patatin-like phospholipase family protein [Ferrimonas balearica]|uniref:patatin-like phospholipase family protein n=1 Tax=Ferrimonas balearica TaxID=44012 RepID=UPI001FEF02F2|nr:patatin-like phospholipase family protein [Ferrimonas balearica]